MKRLHQVLIGVLVVQLALAAVVFWPRTLPAGAAGAALFGDLTAEEVVALVASDKDGRSVELAKEGENWVLPSADNYPANNAKVGEVLAKLTAVRTNRLVTRTAASHAQLKVADGEFESRLELKTGDGAPYVLFLGTSGGAGATHVRASGQNEVYLASDLTSWEVQGDVASWIDTAYVKVPQEDVAAITLKNANGEWTFTKGDGGVWTMAGLEAGEQLNTGSVTSLLSQATGLRVLQPLGKTEQPDYGLAQPLAVVTLKTNKEDQEQTYTIQVGAKDAGGRNYVAKSSASDYFVRVAEYSVADWIEKSREDFLLAATPTPGLPAAPMSTPAP